MTATVKNLHEFGPQIVSCVADPILDEDGDPILDESGNNLCPETDITAAPSEVVLVYDTFSGEIDEIALDLHDPDIDTVGGGWTRNAQTMEIIGDKCLEDGKDNVSISTIDCGEANVIITGDMLVGKGVTAAVGSALVVFRFIDASNYIRAGLSTTSTTPWTWAIYTVIAGSQVARVTQQGTTGGVATIAADMVITLSGDSIQFEIPSESIDMSYSTSFNNTVTRHGIRMFGSSGSIHPTADNFKIVKEL